MKYAIVIPAKNEEQNIKDTLQSVTSQTLQPVICLVVDDQSNDSTPEIIKSISKEFSFIHYFQNEGTSEYILGGNVVRVFNKGKQVIDDMNIDYDFIIKLDADISFSPTFLENIDKKIQTGNWGIVSGTPYYIENKKKIFELSPLWHSHGQFKIYNKKCIEDIGGVDQSLGWDCADNIKAIDKGWSTAAFRDINYLMFRKVGGKTNLTKGRVNHGIGAYKLGYSFIYLCFRALHDIFKPPIFFGAMSLMYGYFKALFSPKTKQILNQQQKKLLRKLYWQSLFHRLSNSDFIVLQFLKKRNKPSSINEQFI